ncbi:MAG TPA: DUF4339 domain-containing protein [Bryobacteraceae bacterium]
MNYWVAPGGQQQGPFSLADVRRMIAEGRVSMTDLAWAEGLPNWAPLSQVIPAEAPAFAPAPAAQPNYGSFGAETVAMPAAAATTGPIPPNLHWALVLIISMFTFGLFGLVWIFVESSFVKRIDPRNISRALLIVAFVLDFAYVGLTMFAAFAGGTSDATMVAGMGFLIMVIVVVCAILAFFKMRSSLVQYYNTVEPIGLKLSGVMTFFFNIYYFQHHFTRIAEWKRTGRLTPQQ